MEIERENHFNDTKFGCTLHKNTDEDYAITYRIIIRF